MTAIGSASQLLKSIWHNLVFMKKIALIKYSLLPKQKLLPFQFDWRMHSQTALQSFQQATGDFKRPLICRQVNEFCVFVFMCMYACVCLWSKDRHGKLWKQNNIKMFHYCWYHYFSLFLINESSLHVVLQTVVSLNNVFKLLLYQWVQVKLIFCKDCLLFQRINDSLYICLLNKFLSVPPKMFHKKSAISGSFSAHDSPNLNTSVWHWKNILVN